MNYRIMQAQNRFNAEECNYRDWQELMYRMFGTSSAKANDMRAAGLNALLIYRDWETDRKSTRLNSSHEIPSRMPSSA